MEREQIIKALECCSINGNCPKCPYNDTSFCVDRIIKDALALIKELTEENERWSDRNRTCIYLSDNETKEYCVGICPAYVTPEEIIADTVRKMHSEIKDRCIKGGIYPAFVARTIDQIVKEKLEETQRKE